MRRLGPWAMKCSGRGGGRISLLNSGVAPRPGTSRGHPSVMIGQASRPTRFCATTTPRYMRCRPFMPPPPKFSGPNTGKSTKPPFMSWITKDGRGWGGVFNKQYHRDERSIIFLFQWMGGRPSRPSPCWPRALGGGIVGNESSLARSHRQSANLRPTECSGAPLHRLNPSLS